MPVESIDQLDTEALRASASGRPLDFRAAYAGSVAASPTALVKDRGSFGGVDEGGAS